MNQNNVIHRPLVDLASLHLLAAALCSAERGWPVIPLHPGTKRPAGHPERSCPGTGRCADGHRTPEQRATTDRELIQAAWARTAYNVGIATGPAGLLVVDLDVCKPGEEEGAPNGAASLAALCERAGQTLPPTYQVRTPSGGRHLYFTAPPGERLPSSVNRLGPHIDTRAWGGYVVAPGSTTSRGAYEILDGAPVAALPHWLTPLLIEPSTPATAAPLLIHESVTRRARVALEREVAAVAGTSEGGRNQRLLEGARALGRFVAWGEIPREEVEQAFQAGGEAAGLSASECRTTIRSALDWSIRTCRPRDAA